nr:hypothetical protein [Tanacetum cinerariifolium]
MKGSGSCSRDHKDVNKNESGLCNALKSKHEENEAIFLRLRLLARHVMTSKLKINTYCSKQLRETIITLSDSLGNSQLMNWGRISMKLFSKSSEEDIKVIEEKAHDVGTTPASI